MKFETLEILATILIFFSVIKLVVISISPERWLNFAKNIYIKPRITSAVALILAATVLYFLVRSGITITHILAITLFITLLIVVGMARHIENIINWALTQDLKALLKKQWFYTLIWIVLLSWGIIDIFFLN